MATTQTLKDKNCNIIGYVETQSDGRQTVSDKHRNVKGYYDPVRDVTTDSNRNIVGRGNLLTSLLWV